MLVASTDGEATNPLSRLLLDVLGPKNPQVLVPRDALAEGGCGASTAREGSTCSVD